MTDRLAIEAQLRAEEELADQVRLERLQLPPEAKTLRLRRLKRGSKRRHQLLVLGKDGRSICAAFVLRWWKKRNSSIRRSAPVTTNEVNRLAAILRRLEE